jgi:predicted transcriptional regulator
MPQLIKKHLEYLGLTDKEAEVYMLLLRSGSLSPADISRKITLKSSTVYFVLNSLNEKGLVREVKTKTSKRPTYQAENPDVLRRFVDNRKKEAERNAQASETIIAELATLQKNRGEKPVIRFYEGRNGVTQSLKEYLSAKGFSEKMDYGIYSYDLMEKIFSPADIAHIEKHRVDNNIKFRALYTGQGEVSVELQNQEVIKMDQEQFPVKCDIGVFEDEIRFHILSDAPHGIVIKNPHIATTIKGLINYVFMLKNGK